MPRRRSPSRTRSRRSPRRSPRRSLRRSPRRRSPRRRTGRKFRATVTVGEINDGSVKITYPNGTQLTGKVIDHVEDTLTIQFGDFPRDLKEHDKLVISGQQWTVSTVHQDHKQIVFTRRSGNVDTLSEMLTAVSLAPPSIRHEALVDAAATIPHPFLPPQGINVLEPPPPEVEATDDLELTIETPPGSSRMFPSSTGNILGNQPDDNEPSQMPSRIVNAPRRSQRPGDLANLRHDETRTPQGRRDRSPLSTGGPET